MSDLPTIDSIRDAAARISAYIHHTPVLTSQSLNLLAGCNLYFKCENFQRSGAFKIRGAMNALLQLSPQEREQGIITHSSGNHGSALALASKLLCIDCTIVLPDDVPTCKVQAIEAYGAKIIRSRPGMPAREEVTREITSERSLILVHPYDDVDVIAGQGTAMLEFHNQVPQLDALVIPVGGGGLIAGCGLVAQAQMKSVPVIGVEPMGLDEARRSLAKGSRQPATGKKTLADGLQGGIGELNFQIVQNVVNDIVTVTENEILQVTLLVWERMKIIVEPSAVVGLAAILAGKLPGQPAHIGTIFTGGNADIQRLYELI